MIDELLKNLVHLNCSTKEFEEIYNILLQNANNMSVEQLKIFKLLALKKIQYDSNSYFKERERTK